MKKTILAALIFAATGSWFGGEAQAIPILFDRAYNVDGVFYDFVAFGGTVPASADESGFVGDLGTISVTVTGAGAHNIHLFVDYDLGVEFFDDLSEAVGVPALGQTWETDEPGFILGSDIDLNIAAGTLDNTVGFPFPEDVAMALGFDFVLAEGDTATVEFTLALTPPPGGFFLHQFDSVGQEELFFSANLSILAQPPLPAPVPEPASLALIATGLIGLAARSRRTRKS